ncbi:hypothetical protein [Streptomyces tendae]|uniref:hypothetical protein n=1 Tax=Streptomyces tendae TaxID=1932 RepID=UPI0034388C76
MTDGISDEPADVVGVLTERIEARFDMGMAELKAAVAAAPTANRSATDVVKCRSGRPTVYRRFTVWSQERA